MAGAITPVPGGVGPLTIAMLMANTVKAAKLRRGSRMPALATAEHSPKCVRNLVSVLWRKRLKQSA